MLYHRRRPGGFGAGAARNQRSQRGNTSGRKQLGRKHFPKGVATRGPHPGWHEHGREGNAMIHTLGAIVLASAGVLGFFAGYRWNNARKRGVRKEQVRDHAAPA